MYSPNEPGLITFMTFFNLIVGATMDLVRFVTIFGTTFFGDDTAASTVSAPFFRTFRKYKQYTNTINSFIIRLDMGTLLCNIIFNYDKVKLNCYP